IPGSRISQRSSTLARIASREEPAVSDALTSDTGAYRFFHPPRCPGAPPLERGLGFARRGAARTEGEGFRAVHFVEMWFVDAGGRGTTAALTRARGVVAAALRRSLRQVRRF